MNHPKEMEIPIKRWCLKPKGNQYFAYIMLGKQVYDTGIVRLLLFWYLIFIFLYIIHYG